MKKILLLLTLVTMLTGCFGTFVPKVVLDGNARSAISNKTLVLTKYHKPGFKTYSPTDNAYTAAGFIVTVPDGNKLIANNGIDDPALAIGDQIASMMSNAHGTKTVSTPVTITGNSPGALAAAAHGTAQYVLDIRTIHWGVMNFPHDRTRYQFTYYGSAILVDTATKTSVAQGVCGRQSDGGVTAPTYAQLSADDAQWLKKELALTVSDCVASYMELFIAK